MNKDNRNNLKLMKLYELLMTESDENHPMTTRTLCERLARIGIPSDEYKQAVLNAIRSNFRQVSNIMRQEVF